MAELLLSQVFMAGRKIVHAVGSSEDYCCADEVEELAKRVQSTLGSIQEAAPTLENTALLRKTLLELKAVLEGIDDLLQLCLPEAQQPQQQGSSSASPRPKESLQGLKDFPEKLDRIAALFFGPLRSAANGRSGRPKDALLAIRIARQERPGPSLKRARRLLRGEVADGKLVELGESLGTGSLGVVMAGTYYGKPVAIKRALFGALSAKDREFFRREASTHFALRHDRVVRVIAFRTGGGSRPPCLVMERMDRTLHQFLGADSAPLELPSVLLYLMDVCEGLKYLHESGINHGDLKSHNVLLDGAGAKISDCGLGHVCSAIGLKTGNGAFLADKTGERFWLAPEVFRWRRSSFDSDVFSLHVVVWEMIEHRQGGDGRAVGEALLEDPREKLPIRAERGEVDPARERLHRLVRSCGRLERDARPKIGEVLAEAKSIYDSLFGSGSAEPAGAATTVSPVQGGQGRPGRFLRPSDVRRQPQKKLSSKSGGGPWENWRTFGSQRAPHARIPSNVVGDEELEAAQPTTNPSFEEGCDWRQYDVPVMAPFWAGYIAMCAAAFLAYSDEHAPSSLRWGLFLVVTGLFGFAAAVAAAVALLLFAIKREFRGALVAVKAFAVGISFGVSGVGATWLYETARLFGAIAVAVATLGMCMNFLRLMGFGP